LIDSATPIAAALIASLAEPGPVLLRVTEFAALVLLLNMLLCFYRLMRGPHLADRALAVDTIAIQLIGLVLVLTIRLRTLHYLEGVLLLSLLGFAGTVAMAQYIARPYLRRATPAPSDADATNGLRDDEGDRPSDAEREGARP